MVKNTPPEYRDPPDWGEIRAWAAGIRTGAVRWGSGGLRDPRRLDLAVEVADQRAPRRLAIRAGRWRSNAASELGAAVPGA